MQSLSIKSSNDIIITKNIKLNEVLIEISQNCNLSCIMCGFGRENNRNDKFLSFDSFKMICDKIAPYTDNIRLNGRGESSIHKDFIPIIKYTYSKNKQITLFSNLSFKNYKIIESFLLTNPQIYISIDSPYKDNLESIRRGAKYENIISNLESLNTLAKRPFIIFTMQEINYTQIVPIAEFALYYNCGIIYNAIRRDSGVSEFSNIIKSNIDTIKKDFEYVRKLFLNHNLTALIPSQIAGINLFDYKNTCKEKDICPNIQKELFIHYDGNVGVCNMFNPYIVGNIYKQSLEEILYGEKMQKFIKQHKIDAYCKNCACLKD